MSPARVRTAMRAVVAGLMLAVASAGTALAADDVACHLTQITSLEMMTEPNGLVSVPATVAGLTGQLLVDTGGINTLIGQSVANGLGLTAARSGPRAAMLGGVPIEQFVRPKTFQLGMISSLNMAMMIAPSSVLTTGTIGMLAPNYLSHFDVEFDFAAGRFYLFSQDHCAGSVVHWTRSAYAVLPFQLDPSGHIFVMAVLDGKTVRAVLDTGAERSTMTLDQAQALFGIKGRSDPALKLLGPMSINGTAATEVYRYPFSTLAFNGMQVQNPDIEILTRNQFAANTPQLIVGMETLRQLHLYIAYSEKAVYLTPAETR